MVQVDAPQPTTIWLGVFYSTLELYFGPSTFGNHQAKLFKLLQLGTVSDYQLQFEKLHNRVHGLTPKVILNCFILGLILEICTEMSILRPSSLANAIGFAKLVEAMVKASKVQHFTCPIPLTTRKHYHNPSHNPIPNPLSLPFKKLTPSQYNERHIKGLCYYCDEKFHIGHRCQNKQLFLTIIASMMKKMSQALTLP